MASKYREADLESCAILKALIEEHYADLNAANVTFDLVLAYGAEDEQGVKTGPALKYHGFPVTGVSKIINLLNRSMGRRDAEILIDGDVWEEFTPEEKKAILDHQLQYFDIARNATSELLRDSANRPKLKMRLPTRAFEWFDLIAARHGENSLELKQARQIYDECAQVYFPFLKEKAISGRKPLKVLKMKPDGKEQLKTSADK